MKERLRQIHLALKPAINTKDQGNWRRYKCQVYYGSFVSRLVQEVLKDMNQFSHELVVPEDIDVAVDRQITDYTFECFVQSDLMKRKLGNPAQVMVFPYEYVNQELNLHQKLDLDVNVCQYFNLIGRKLLLKCDSDITSVIASIEYSEDGSDFDIKLCWTPEFDEFISTGETTCDLIYRTQDASQFIRFLYKVMRSQYTFKIVGTQLKFKRILTGHFFKPHLAKLEALKKYALENKDNTNPACCALCEEINILSCFSIIPRHRSDVGAYKISKQRQDNGCSYFEPPDKCMMFLWSDRMSTMLSSTLI